MVKSNWIGKPLGKERPHDFFRSPAKYKPVNMFKDSDRDGVPNVFDCKPFDPKKQGLIDAIVGAVKGAVTGTGIKSGWQAGMARPGYLERRAEKRRAAQIAQMKISPVKYYSPNSMKYSVQETRPVRKVVIQQKPLDPAIKKMLSEQALIESGAGFQRVLGKPTPKPYSSQEQVLATTYDVATKPKMEYYYVPGAYPKAEKRNVLNKNLASMKLQQLKSQAISKMQSKYLYYRDPKELILEKPLRAVSRMASSVTEKLRSVYPNYEKDLQRERYKRIIADKNSTRQQRDRARVNLAKTEKVLKSRKEKFRTRAIEAIFPVPSLTSYGSGSKTIQGVPSRGRGRPRGTLDRRYAAYGGVFGYRRYVAAQRKLLKQKLKQQEAMLRQQSMPQYEQVQQLPPEVQAAMQQQQPPQQMQQMPQQMPQQYPQQYPQQQQQPFEYVTEPEPRPIATVFKGSGGKPYPAVDTRPLAPPRQTLPQGYVETTDAFTGRRFLKKVPPPERWAGSY